MKLIVGLGNPGRRYTGTRHNVGFAVVETLAHRCGPGSPRLRFHGEVRDVQLAEQRVLLLCPQTYMNRSGLSVLEARDFYKLDLADMLVICDDINLPLARLRCRTQGSSGGQKGLEDILRRLATDEIARLRIGIGTPPERCDPADYVLGRFPAEEVVTMQTATERAADAATDWVRHGMSFCMNRYNAEVA